MQVPPPKQKDTRDRFWLTEQEVNSMIAAARENKRHGLRDGTLILMMYTHGLRTIEAINLKWTQINFATRHIFIKRAKNGKDSTHPLRGKAMRALRQLQRDYPDSAYIFSTERKGPLAERTVREIISQAGKRAGLDIAARPHMLRHGCGCKLAQKEDTRAIQDYLGHKNIHHTVRYTQLSPRRFDDFWRD